LGLGAPVRAQKIGLGVRLDTLCYGAGAKGDGYADDGTYD
jgi:hypothetical protein